MRIATLAACLLLATPALAQRPPAPTEAYTGRVWHVIDGERCVRLDTTTERAASPEALAAVAARQGIGLRITYEASPLAGAGNRIAHVESPTLEPFDIFPTFMSCGVSLSIAREQAGLPALPPQDPRDAVSARR